MSTGFKVIQSACRAVSGSLPTQVKTALNFTHFCIKLLVSIFNREIFSPLSFFYFFPDFLNRLWDFFVFIFNAFFLAGIPETVLALVAYIL